MAIDNFGDEYSSDVEAYCADVERGKAQKARIINFYSLLYKNLIDSGICPGVCVYSISDEFQVVIHTVCSVAVHSSVYFNIISYICDDGFMFYACDIGKRVFCDAKAASELSCASRREVIADNSIWVSMLEAEILKAYAECGMDRSATAQMLSYCPGNIDYHLRKIRDRTGYDPRDFADLRKLINRMCVGN